MDGWSWLGLIFWIYVLTLFTTINLCGKEYENSKQGDYAFAVRNGFFNWSEFNGKATRSEFWYFLLYTFWVSLAFQLMDFAVGVTSEIQKYEAGFWDAWILSTIFTVIVAIPTLAVGARRLHAVGKSGWWQLISLTVIGIIPLIIWWGQKDVNLTKSKKSYKRGKLSNELEEIKELYKDGTLTKEEFIKAKEKLLK